jgi:hypothetical protein
MIRIFATGNSLLDTGYTLAELKGVRFKVKTKGARHRAQG